MKKQFIWVFEWRKSVHYWRSYILFSPECKELTSMLDPLLYRWGVPPDVIRCVHWTMQMWVLQTSITAQSPAIVMFLVTFNIGLLETTGFIQNFIYFNPHLTCTCTGVDSPDIMPYRPAGLGPSRINVDVDVDVVPKFACCVAGPSDFFPQWFSIERSRTASPGAVLQRAIDTRLMSYEEERETV